MVRKLVLLAVALSTVLAAIPVLASTRQTDIASSAGTPDLRVSSSTNQTPGVARVAGR